MFTKIKEFFTAEEKNKLAFSYSGILRFVPLIIAGGFFAFTIFLVAFGPYDWHINNGLKFYGFLIACLIALVVGYLLAVYKTSSAPREHMKINVSRILLVCIAVAFIIYIPTLKVATGKWYPDVYTGITKTGLAYQMAKYYSQFSPKLLFYVRMLLAPLTIAITPITLFYKSRLTKTAFCAGIFMTSLGVALSIAQGITKQVADTLMQLVLFLVIIMFSSKFKTKKAAVLHFTKYISIILVLCIAFFAYYSNAMRNRLSADVYMGENALLEENESNNSSNDKPSSEKDNYSTNKKPSKVENDSDKINEILGDKESLEDDKLNEIVDTYSSFSVATERENSIWNKVLPSKIRPMFKYLTSYFCHGYYGLSLAMEQDFTSSYGFGFSDFIRHNMSRFFGGEQFEKQMYQRTYMSKLSQYGWQVGLYWSTFFVYPASDISFAGTVLLVLLIGFLFGLSWKDAVLGGNPFAMGSFFCFCTMIIYFSANNQMFQSGEPCIGFTAIIALWLITRFVWVKKSRR